MISFSSAQICLLLLLELVGFEEDGFDVDDADDDVDDTDDEDASTKNATI